MADKTGIPVVGNAIPPTAATMDATDVAQQSEEQAHTIMGNVHDNTQEHHEPFAVDVPASDSAFPVTTNTTHNNNADSTINTTAAVVAAAAPAATTPMGASMTTPTTTGYTGSPSGFHSPGRRPRYANPSVSRHEKYDPSLPWYTYDIAHCFVMTGNVDVAEAQKLGVAPNLVETHRKELGDNIIPISGGPNWFKMLLRHFTNAITIILGIVVIISAYFQDWAEFGVVLFVIIFNGLLGFYQEFSAEKSLESLKAMTAGSATVIRGGHTKVIPIDEAVVGDVVVLEQGASVPADLRLFEVANLEIDEALLTGEALPVVKTSEVISDPQRTCALGDRKNMAFRNTLVTSGRGKGILVAGGVHTEMGKLAKALSNNEGSSNKTALMKKLEWMMFALFGCCIILGVIVFAANRFEFHESTLLYACAVAIAIIPESLSVVITVAMTLSVRRMAQQRCIVRKLTVLEVLSGVTDICSDKTGTLTENKMVVKQACIGIGNNYNVVGAPHSAMGEFFPENIDLQELGHNFALSSPTIKAKSKNMSEELNAMYRNFFRCAALCSSTVVRCDPDSQTIEATGNPTEIAIQVMTWKASLTRAEFEEGEGWELCGEYAFDSEVKRMSAVFRHREDGSRMYSCTKGAPERVLQLCKWFLTSNGEVQLLSDKEKEVITETIEQLASRGLRTICFSERNISEAPLPPMAEEEERFDKLYGRESVESDLIFLGIVGIFDPPRPESRPAVEVCQHAGITVRMLTGDHADTAAAIAEALTIIDDMEQDSDKVLTGPELDAMAEDEVDDLLDLPRVVGRCSPQSKVKMIESLHRRKRVVAMTGDGFNDSPSIKIADVGIAMGSGTDVTKGVADIVITDDNFATIVTAVKEGRRISDSIKKFVVHLLSSNVAEVITLILGLPIQLNGRSVFILSPIEILWLNMFTGSPCATGLSMDDADETALLVPPSSTFFTKELILDTFAYGIALGLCCLSSFIYIVYGYHGGFEESAENCNSSDGKDCSVAWTARAAAFCVMYLGLLIHAYNIRNTRKSIFLIRWFDNAWLWGSVLFGIVTLMGILYIEPVATYVFLHERLTWEWIVVAIALTIFVACSEVYKIVKNCLMPLPIIHVPKHHPVVHPATPGLYRPHYASFASVQSPGMHSAFDRTFEEDEYNGEEEMLGATSSSSAQHLGTPATSLASPGFDRRAVEDIARENLAMSFHNATVHHTQELQYPQHKPMSSPSRAQNLN